MDGFDVILLCILVAMVFFVLGYLCGMKVWYKNRIDGLAFVGPFDLKVMLSITKREAESKNYIVLQTVPAKDTSYTKENDYGEDYEN